MSETQPLASSSPAKPVTPKNRKCVNHMKRFWWIHVLIWLALIVLIILLTIFRFIPLIAQRVLNDAELGVQHVSILDSEPGSYWIQIDATVRSKGIFAATLDPFRGTLELDDIPEARPFVTLDFPATSANKFQAINISQRAFIEDLQAFTRFNKLFFQNETLRVRIRGETKVQPQGMEKKYDVTFSKAVEFKGLNLLKDTLLTNSNVSFSPSGPNFNATTKIVNPSYYTMDIGNATFNSYADGELVGNLTVRDLLLQPGSNAAPVNARLNLSQILDIVSRPSFCDTGIVPFRLQGTSVMNDGHQIPWLQSALSSANQTVEIDVGAVLGKPGAGFCENE